MLSFQVVFVGLLIGAPFWGFVADKHGRKKVYIHACTYSGITLNLQLINPKYLTIRTVLTVVLFCMTLLTLIKVIQQPH